jgi:hypothetical protein
VDWGAIDGSIIAPTGIDTLQIIDSCYSLGFTPSITETTPDDFAGRGALAVLASAASDTETGNPLAGANQVAFHKAISFVLEPPLDAAGNRFPALAFTPDSLFRALPVVDQAFSIFIDDTEMTNAIVSGLYTPKFYELAIYIDIKRKIAPLPGNCICRLLET